MTSEQFIAVGSVISIVVSLVCCTAWVVSRITRIEVTIIGFGARITKLEDRYDDV